MDRSPNTVKGALVWLMAGKKPIKARQKLPPAAVHAPFPPPTVWGGN
jgi:hypothetical protein